jgi:hypothetical protein
MNDHNIDRLEGQIKELHYALKLLSDDDALLELIRIIRQPGWTTPAEFILVTGVTEALHAHTRAMIGLKQVLMSGSREIAASGVGKIG